MNQPEARPQHSPARSCYIESGAFAQHTNQSCSQELPGLFASLVVVIVNSPVASPQCIPATVILLFLFLKKPPCPKGKSRGKRFPKYNCSPFRIKGTNQMSADLSHNTKRRRVGTLTRRQSHQGVCSATASLRHNQPKASKAIKDHVASSARSRNIRSHIVCHLQTSFCPTSVCSRAALATIHTSGGFYK